MSEKVHITVDPNITTLSDLLEIAEQSPSGAFTIKGEREDGTVEWGIAVVCNNASERTIDIIQKVFNTIADQELVDGMSEANGNN